MEEKAIFFKEAMVRAILSGNKTMTRRVAELTDTGRVKKTGSSLNWHPRDPNASEACPYTPGQRLWVREGFMVQPSIWSRHHNEQPVHYTADTPAVEAEDYVSKPSIHMPRWACRIFLKVRGVRLERLQDITDEDALAEGIRGDECELGDQTTPIMCFEALWASIYGAESWKLNPWVWVVQFQRVDE